MGQRRFFAVVVSACLMAHCLNSSSAFGQLAFTEQAEPSTTVELCGYTHNTTGPHPWLENLSLFGGVEGSKQPQDFGVNANLGGRFHANWGVPLLPDFGLGMQLGTALVSSDNAVRVYELLGEEGGRLQSFTTTGLFQRFENGLSWGIAYDFLYTESFDDFFLGQWRIRTAYDWSKNWQIGMTVNIAGEGDTGEFNATTVSLDPISQAHWYCRRFWETGTQTTFWAGIAEGHGEDNAVTGPSGAKDEVFLFGADFLAPLNDRLALYGETNLMMPADTGTVDAFLGVQWFPWGNARQRTSRAVCSGLANRRKSQLLGRLTAVNRCNWHKPWKAKNRSRFAPPCSLVPPF